MRSAFALREAADGGAPLVYKHEKLGSMGGNSGGGNTGPGDISFPGMPLPNEWLRVSNLVEGETVTFPFEALNPSVRGKLSSCLAGK